MRYLGYANEVGEALSAWLFRGGVPLSYAVAICYILTDTSDKWRRAGAAARARLGPGEEHASAVRLLGMERGLDTLVWHLLASLILPGMTIHYAVAAATRALEALPATGPGQRLAETLARGSALGSDAPLSTVSKAIPTLLGLALIPLIARPIDRGVHALLDATLRPVLRKVLEGTGALRVGPGKEDGDRE